ncbi:hypothetical protein AKJ09_10731 [Labilithrix luteola]|uniref:Uncharacterized protein n=1 Tax=Labilithrix luteola TaxID=1391654 RepID=A0A0K1QEB3_9BACT|nr:hypothetical protein AKJ09_10731 [Labilithrix luteola]
MIESLDALVRLSRWNHSESKPEPLVIAVAKLQDRLGAAERLAGSNFNGSSTEAAKVTAMCVALKRLSASYLQYCKQIASPLNVDDAANSLESEISATSATSDQWG